ncbi:Fe-S cluster assembly protein SufD [Luteimonas pelagia]
MPTLLPSLAEGFDGDAGRRGLLEAALRDGLPGPRSEAWKYTPLRALERRTFAPARTTAPAIDGAVLADVRAPRLVFVNGVRDATLEDLSGLGGEIAIGKGAVRDATVPADDVPRPDLVFARLNAALAGDPVDIRVPAGVRADHPLNIVFLAVPGDADVATHARVRVTLDAGAALTLVEHHRATGDHADLGTRSVEVEVERGASLVHARIQDEASRATLFARTTATLLADAGYRRFDLELGAALSRHELDVRLEGTGARLAANGVLLADGRRHLDTRLAIDHVAGDTACDLAWRGLGAGRGRAVFHGGITIHAGADGSEASLSNKNLLLSEGAEIDTQPVLVIHADEVQAAHGATVGRLDPIALFYLRSRGLPEGEARRLLTAAFCREVVKVEDEKLQATLATALERALARLEPTA